MFWKIFEKFKKSNNNEVVLKNDERIILEKVVQTWKIILVEKLWSSSFSIRFVDNNSNWEIVSVTYNVEERELAEKYLNHFLGEYWKVVSEKWANSVFKSQILNKLTSFEDWKKENNAEEEDGLILSEELSDEDEKINELINNGYFNRIWNILQEIDDDESIQNFVWWQNLSISISSIEEYLKKFENETYMKEFWVKIVSVKKSWDSVEVQLGYNKILHTWEYNNCIGRSFDDFYSEVNREIFSDFGKMVCKDIQKIIIGYLWERTIVSEKFNETTWNSTITFKKN